MSAPDVFAWGLALLAAAVCTVVILSRDPEALFLRVWGWLNDRGERE